MHSHRVRSLEYHPAARLSGRPRTRDAFGGWHSNDGVPDVVLRAAKLTAFDLVIEVLQAQAAHDRRPATAGLADQLHQPLTVPLAVVDVVAERPLD